MIKLSNLTGYDLEKFGQTVFVEMGFTCIHPLTQPRLTEIEPEGEYLREEKLEIDCLIPSEKICLIGIQYMVTNVLIIKRFYRYAYFFTLRKGLSVELIINFFQKPGHILA